MLTHHRKPVCLSFMALDMPLWSVVETAATLYQKDTDRFHLLLTEPVVLESVKNGAPVESVGRVNPGDNQNSSEPTPRLLWLELSPYRVIMTMQGNGQYSYRHFWEQGVYGLSRYWLQGEANSEGSQIRLRNYTRSLTMEGKTLPQALRLEYELWSGKVQMGNYALHLEIHH